MKVNPILMFIATFASLLVGYIFYLCCSDLHIAIGIGVSSLFILNFTLGVFGSDPRISINQKVVSSVFFLISLIQNIFCALFDVSLPLYIAISASVLLLWLLIVYLLNSRKQD